MYGCIQRCYNGNMAGHPDWSPDAPIKDFDRQNVFEIPKITPAV